MPYLIQTSRERVDEELMELGIQWAPENAAELNFAVSSFIAKHLETQGVSYSAINEMIGALECAKLELYRVLASPYEDTKMQQNGGVYGKALEA